VEIRYELRFTVDVTMTVPFMFATCNGQDGIVHLRVRNVFLQYSMVHFNEGYNTVQPMTDATSI